MQALFFTVFAARGLGALGSVGVESQSSCQDIVQEAEASSVLGETDRAQVVFAQCQLRPSVLTKEKGTAQDCQEFARLYQLARHYSQKGVTPAEFCLTLQSYSESGGLATDSRIMSHSACVTGLSKVLGNQQVGEAAEEACVRIYTSVANAAVMCKKLVNVLADTPDDGTLDTARLCDRLLTGGNGTRRLDREHFLYSCVQYASNVVAESTADGLLLAAQDVQRSCHQHFSVAKNAPGFCSGYADLVRRHAAVPDISEFCGAQYEHLGSEVLGHESETHDASQTAAGMTAMCQQAAAQVVSSGHEPGPALQHRAEDVCASELQSLAPHAPKPQVHLGCRFFAKHLDDEVKRSGADVDIASFCETLGGRPAPAPAPPPSRSAAPERQSVEKELVVDNDSLGGFLSAFDIGPPEKSAVASDAKASEVETLPQAVVPEPAKPTPVQSSERSTNQRSSSFLRPVTPHRVDAPQNSEAALQTSTVSVQSDSGIVSPDIDTLVSLFQSPSE